LRSRRKTRGSSGGIEFEDEKGAERRRSRGGIRKKQRRIKLGLLYTVGGVSESSFWPPRKLSKGNSSPQVQSLSSDR